MDTVEAFASFALFGIRLDSATLAQATLAAWEGALSRAAMRVMLVDMWTLLAGQREFSTWEALSAADYVYPIADDAVLRRAAQHQHMAVMKPDLILYDLLDAAARANRPVALLAPPAELDSDVALVRRIWPQLQVHSVSRGNEELYEPDSKLVESINHVAPALLIMGGYSPWQEEFVHNYRDELEFGTVLTMPTLYTAMAAIGQRVGMPVMGIGRMRRRAAISRAITSTLRPAAEASAETVGTWIAGARDGFTAALHTRQSPAALRRIAAIDAPSRRAIAVRVTQARELEESNSRWAATSPLARISPPRLPALPAPSTATPSSSAARWPAPPATGSGSAESARLLNGAWHDQHEDRYRAEGADDDLVAHSRSPFEPEWSEEEQWMGRPSLTLGAASGTPLAPADVATQHTAWLSPSESGAVGDSSVREPVVDSPPDRAAPPSDSVGGPEEDADEYDTFVVEPDSPNGARDASEPDGAEPDGAERVVAHDATQLLSDDAALDFPRREPSGPDQLGATTLLSSRSVFHGDPEALRVLASIDDLPPTRRLNQRTVEGLPGGRRDLPTPDGEAVEEPPTAPATRPLADDEAGTKDAPTQKTATRISRKYVVRRMPRHIGHRHGRPRR